MRNGVVVIVSLLVFGGRAWADSDTFWYSTKTKVATSTAAQSATTLWTPASGYRIILQGCMISTSRATQVRFQVSGTDVIPPVYITSMGSSLVGGSHAPIYVSAADAVLTYTTSITGFDTVYGNVSVMCWGWEDQF